MILTNEMEKENKILMSHYLPLITLLAPMAPHISEEIWSSFAKALEDKQYKRSIFLQPWPKYEPALVREETITLVIQINGKVRDKIEVKTDISEEEAKKLTLNREKVKKWIEGKEIKKVVFVPGKLINIVV